LIVSRLSIIAVATLLSVGLTLFATSSRAHGDACPTSITACGCTITSGTLSIPYSLANDLLFAPSTGDCIDISAPLVELIGNGHTITGSSSGTGTVGIHVLPSAQSAEVLDATVTGFGTGVQLDGKQAVVFFVDSNSNGKGFLLNGPSTFMET